MNAKIADHYARKRQPLHEIVPLDTPFSCSIETSTFCNLKCNFCIHSLSKKDMLEKGHVFAQLDTSIFNKMVQQLKAFPRPIKTIAFVGCGEPLLHRDLPYMVETLKNSNIVKEIIIVTNGILLSHQLSNDLNNAGLDTIKISVNGLSSDDYKSTCGVRVDFDNYKSEIEYLYHKKGNIKIMIKILSSALKGRKEEFYHIFGNICDVISVENTMPFYEGVSYEKILQGEENTSRFQSVKRKAEICSAPFFRLSLKYNGQVKFCGCHSGITTEGMSINNSTIAEIWNSEEHKQILLNVLNKNWTGITEYCNHCCSRNDFAFEEDNLDPYVTEIINRIL